MKVRVRQWGNSIGIRIPHNVAKDIGIVDGTELEMNVVHRDIVLSRSGLTLSDLLKEVTPENIHGEVDTGSVIGKEIW